MNHPEGFKLMKYRCAAGHVEIIWNSRDGATPFIVTCHQSRCGADSQHIEWRSDVYAPDHAKNLKPGDRYFRDGLPAEARAYMRQRVGRLRPQYPITDEEAAELIRQAGTGECHEFSPGWPKLVTAGTDEDSLSRPCLREPLGLLRGEG